MKGKIKIKFNWHTTHGEDIPEKVQEKLCSVTWSLINKKLSEKVQSGFFNKEIEGIKYEGSWKLTCKINL